MIGIFMNQIMQRQPMTVFGDGEQTRAFSYIDDVALYIANSVNVPEAYNEVFNIGADQPYTVNYLVEVVARAFGVAPDIRYLPARNELVDAYSDHSKAQRIFGQNTAIPLEEGVARMARWAREVGARKSSTFKGVEVPRNMPPSWKAALEADE